MKCVRATGLALGMGFSIFSGLASAEPRFYLGVEGGLADITLEQLDDDQYFSAFAGVHLLDVLAFEVGYGSLGEYDNNIPGSSSSVEVDSVIQALLTFHGPLLTLDKGAIHLRYGYYQADLTADNPNGRQLDDTARNFTAGLGVSYPIIGPLSLGVNYQYFHDVDEQAINTYSGSLRLDF